MLWKTKARLVAGLSVVTLGAALPTLLAGPAAAATGDGAVATLSATPDFQTVVQGQLAQLTVTTMDFTGTPVSGATPHFNVFTASTPSGSGAVTDCPQT